MLNYIFNIKIVYIEIYFYIALTFNILNCKPKLSNTHFTHPNITCMYVKFLKIALLLCLSTTFVYGQKKTVKNTDKKKGMFSFSVNYSDYGFFKAVKDSSISHAFNRKGLFKSGNTSFGFGVSYWKGLALILIFRAILQVLFQISRHYM